MQPVLAEYLHDYPEIPILLRGDSGFSTPDLYKQCEENGTSYVIRLKENGILRGKAGKTRLFTCTHLLSQTWIPHQSILSNFTASEG